MVPERERVRRAIEEERARLEGLLEASEGDAPAESETVPVDLVAKHLNELDVLLAERGLDMIDHVDLPKLDRWLTHAAEKLRQEKR